MLSPMVLAALAEPMHVWAGFLVRARRHAKLQTAVELLMTLIIRTVNDKKDHIPPVTSAAVLTFPFEITIAG